MKRIILMGSPEFSVPTFEAVMKSSTYKVVALYCQCDKKSGRGLKPTSPQCKVLAQEKGIPVFQPIRLKSKEVFSTYKDLKPDLTLVAAYGMILPKPELNRDPGIGNKSPQVGGPHDCFQCAAW